MEEKTKELTQRSGKIKRRERLYDSEEKFYDGLAAVGFHGKYGFINEDGREIVEPQYDLVFTFCNGVAMVTKNNFYGIINKEGKELVKPDSYDLMDYSEKNDLFNVRQNKKWGVIDRNGKIIVPVEYEIVGFCLKKDIVYINKKGKYGLYNVKTRQKITNFKYKEIVAYSPKYALIKGKKGEGLINEKGQEIIPPEYDDIYANKDGTFKVVKYEYFNANGEKLISPVTTE